MYCFVGSQENTKEFLVQTNKEDFTFKKGRSAFVPYSTQR